VYDYLTYLWDRGYSRKQLSQFYKRPYSPPKSFNMGDFNYPTITIVAFTIGLPTTVSRALTNVGTPSTYRLHVKAPPEVQISVQPRILKFEKKGQIKKFKVTATWNSMPKNDLFGRLVWTDGEHHVNTPIVLRYSKLD
jgi:hypothetical protein